MPVTGARPASGRRFLHVSWPVRSNRSPPKRRRLQGACEAARSPSPIFHYIDGAAEDETSYRRNTEAFSSCDLVPNVLTGVEKVDMSVS
ncbi:MAG: alpha-hydroxy-acid oxidizing protein, partial [Asticcacaulis sp.]|nr:alpha-hydroxy-acid oxidizing protein [Asticcacaulis sp.]